ncbi:hypothetical protein N0V88_005148 [Collariella sp. IMI 366227]|nr:hypothetical protein N0V88_005148 [Collariella sp. IMI 366227]
MALPLGTQRLFLFTVPALLALVFFIFVLRSGSVDVSGIRVFGNGASHVSYNRDSFSGLLYELYKPIKLPVTAKHYTDQRGFVFGTSGRVHWTTPLGKDILVVDIDTRKPDGENEIFSEKQMHWDSAEAKGPGLLSISHINHFLYAQIHGYDYRFLHAQEMEGHWHTWIKPHVLQAMLASYKFVVFIDADAIIQHLEVPLEFLFNRWDVSPQTSIAMPLDTRQRTAEGKNMSTDSKNNTVLNSGFIVLQNLPHTQDMMQAWIECTTEKRYPGCGHWKEKWSHEQRAFSEYIRYDFNPDGNNIVEIPCNDANGFPGLVGHFDVIDDCKGEFFRHFTMDKGVVKTSTADVLMQTITGLIQKNFVKNNASILVEEGHLSS